MTDQPSCTFEDCDQAAGYQLRFELAEPSDPDDIVGVFVLAVCGRHFRPEFAVEITPAI